MKKKNYKSVAKNYRLIKNAGVRLVVPWPGEAELFQRVSRAAQAGRVTPALLREAAPITLTCYDEAAVRLYAAPITLRKGKIAAETGYFLLNAGFEDRYDPVTGFCAEDDLYKSLML